MEKYQFPVQAEQYVAWAKAEIQKYPYRDEQVTDQYGLRWYDVAPQRQAVQRASENILFFSPHSDDMEIAAGVTMTSHVQQGDNVSEILFTVGSAGRYSRGFNSKTLPDVRIAEALVGAKTIGIQRLGVLMNADNTVGLPEWFSIPDTPDLRKLGVALARKYNPNILYSPHPDSQVDTHPDHQVVASIAKWAYSWGPENAFYQDAVPGIATNLSTWRRFAIWTGQQNLSPNFHTRYRPNSQFESTKRQAIEVFQSQGGVIYANAGIARDTYTGGMMYVGDDEQWLVESFHEVKNATVYTPEWI